MLWRIKTFWRRIKRFYAWFPIIWNDEEWDEAYLFKIMRFKIKRMAEDMKKFDRHTTVERDYRDMMITCELLHRFEFYEEPFPLPECKCDPNAPMFEDIPGSDYSRWVWKPCAYCKLQWKYQTSQEEANWKLLWKYMEKHSRKWWS